MVTCKITERREGDGRVLFPREYDCIALIFRASRVLMRLAHFSEAPIINVPVRIEDTCKIEVSVVLHLT